MNDPIDAVFHVFCAVVAFVFARHLWRTIQSSVSYHKKYETKAAKAESMERHRDFQQFDWLRHGGKSPTDDPYKNWR